MVVADPLMNLPKYVVSFCEVDTLQERGRESSSVKFPSYNMYLAAFNLSNLAFFLSSGSLLSLRYRMMGAIQVSVVVTQLTVNCGSVDRILGSLRNSIGITYRCSASLVDASRARASA